MQKTKGQVEFLVSHLTTNSQKVAQYGFFKSGMIFSIM